MTAVLLPTAGAGGSPSLHITPAQEVSDTSDPIAYATVGSI
eukprot:CAMPEP_0179456164 /NCGR_PEP_ID=MMETSP0799-20121207/39949_1 /TAXON_ID=46947 /ORGANISM="Geminigera cryophila, Strain CCMP2564" /LENGTH=40 /DNA_ID= /DNA_START= /DNA_END= /DNA_ORIENTATION=